MSLEKNKLEVGEGTAGRNIKGEHLRQWCYLGRGGALGAWKEITALLDSEEPGKSKAVI